MTHPTQSERANLVRLLELARQEDMGDAGDLTSRILPEDIIAEGKFVSRGEIVVCGVAFLDVIAVHYDADLKTRVLAEEGRLARPGEVLAEWTGPAQAMMSAERVALNFIQRLCGVATATRRFVDAVAGTGAGIYDTRKTTPGWRDLEKYAVRIGGGKNHRRGLYDAVLIKDNHLAILAKAEGADPLAGALQRELGRLRPMLGPDAFVEIEVDTMGQFEAALQLPVEMILLDNMPPQVLRQAVAMRDAAGLAGRVQLEASGGITLGNVREVAATGVERISTGAITHSAGAVDIALDIEML